MFTIAGTLALGGGSLAACAAPAGVMQHKLASKARPHKRCQLLIQ